MPVLGRRLVQRLQQARYIRVGVGRLSCKLLLVLTELVTQRCHLTGDSPDPIGEGKQLTGNLDQGTDSSSPPTSLARIQPRVKDGKIGVLSKRDLDSRDLLKNRMKVVHELVELLADRGGTS